MARAGDYIIPGGISHVAVNRSQTGSRSSSSVGGPTLASRRAFCFSPNWTPGYRRRLVTDARQNRLIPLPSSPSGQVTLFQV